MPRKDGENIVFSEKEIQTYRSFRDGNSVFTKEQVETLVGMGKWRDENGIEGSKFIEVICGAAGLPLPENWK